MCSPSSSPLPLAHRHRALVTLQSPTLIFCCPLYFFYGRLRLFHIQFIENRGLLITCFRMRLCSLPNLMTPRFTWSPTLGPRSPTWPAGSPAQSVLLQPSWLWLQARRRLSRCCCRLPALAAPRACAPHRHPTAVSSHSRDQGTEC